MATEKTPQRKRVKRAEEGRDSWKVKAFERRQEIERLKLELARKEDRLSQNSIEIKEMQKKLTSADKTIIKQQDEIAAFKKKA